MPRIRTIKPEIWSSPGFTSLEPLWRLLFISMLNWADDYGRGSCEPRELMGFSFPNEDEMTVAEFRRGLDEIRRALDVKFYMSSGRHFFAIPSWEKHQKVDRRAKESRFPDPDLSLALKPTNWQVIDESGNPAEDSGENSESSGETSEDSGTGTLEHRNIGTVINTCTPDGARPQKDPSAYPPAFEQWWELYPRKKAKRRAFKRWQEATKRISPDELNAKTQAFRDYVTSENTPEEFIKYPEGWLSGDCWDDELVQRRSQQKASWWPSPGNDVIAGEVVETLELGVGNGEF